MGEYESSPEMIMDIFRELGNVGTGSAAMVLADVMGQRITESVPVVMNLDCDRLLKSMGEIEKRRMGILFPFKGEISGTYLFLLDESFVSAFLKKSLGQTGDFESLNDYGRAAINEMVNLMASSYFKAVSEYTGLKTEIYEPAVSIDMTGAMLLDMAGTYMPDEKINLCIKSDFGLQGGADDSAIVLILYEEPAIQILRVLGVKI